MTKLKSMLLAVACVAALSLSSGNVAAQGRGNFDPAQMRQRMMDNLKEQFGVTDDAEWKVLEGAIGKVVDARLAVASGAIRPGGFGGRRGGNGGGGNNGGDNNGGGNNGGNGGGRRGGGFFGPPSAEVEALQKAIEDKAPADEIKSKLAKVRETNAANEAKLTSAQEDLKKLLTSRQEAIAVLNGLLK